MPFGVDHGKGVSVGVGQIRSHSEVGEGGIPGTPGGRPREVAPGSARRAASSWAAAATAALPVTRNVGSPREQAAEATSVSALAYAVARPGAVAASSLSKAVGAPRDLRPRLAASKKAALTAANSVGAPSMAAHQSWAARGAASAIAAAKTIASSRARSGGRPASVATATRASTASRSWLI
ncbi:MAG: hypothetical protein IPP00_00225 [Actinomycetales bacterium]|uniref:Uncharacterized protein n=1 Tax=Candidatus Phosphoribacter hodrii TaxID=2953743 RepID=A0A9D7T9P3_9MICO|nr:hypothetical protein [Candidatus Phosphoribacter hodrii]